MSTLLIPDRETPYLIPLKHAPDTDAFVVRKRNGTIKLYFADSHLLTYSYDEYLYMYPALTHEYSHVLKAFLEEFAPHIEYNKIRPYIGRSHYTYLPKHT